MTWQQKEDFGHLTDLKKPKSNRFQQVSLDQRAAETLPETAVVENRSLSTKQAKFAASRSRRKPRAKAATSGPPPTSTHKKKTHIPLPGLPKKRDKDGDMSALPKTAYIPPHLRKRSSATAEKTDSVIRSSPNEASPVASDKSKTDQPARIHSSPNVEKHSPTTPPSPPTTPPELEKIDSSKWAGWNETITAVPVPTHKAENPRWPRGPKPAPHKAVWPKAREMKYIPTDSNSDGGISFKSSSNGDPDYDVKKLLDWNGDWLPPPEEWSARRGYTNRHFGQAMEQWMNGHADECDKALKIDSPSYRGQKTVIGDRVEWVLVDGVCKELAPRYWTSVQAEGKPVREFWKDLPKRAPEALTDIDIATDPPWWDLYEDDPSPFLSGLAVPEARIDHTHLDNHVHPLVLASATERVQDILDRKAHKHRRMIARRNRPLPAPRSMVTQGEDKRIRPTANIYVRPINPADVRAIAEIYNHYVENTIHANEFDGRTEAHIRDRINNITQHGLPYLVAVAKGSKPLSSQGYISEKIIGYINLDDYCDQSSMYRFTFEMELFVHPGYTHKSVARCLLDRLLEMANTGYNARGGYEYVNEFEYLKTGPSRVIKTILLNVHHEHGADIQKATDYLHSFKFIRAGRLSHVGFKKGKIVDISIYQHHTTETINPSGIPTVPLGRN
ncbi:hypothetical protein BKA66DRAFT_510870 [Pyrenochaeta sp. MPI-SDFR-AT-0127]|nr:hypothetical protein BKA66DRAFT_510870 [Pyrenochaeta sp. MPI-SDFR-AT-0127]